jgi:hypothetical protein
VNNLKFFLYFVFKTTSFRNRVKRGDPNTESQFNLYINTLIVIDRTVYVWFKETYSTLRSDSLVTNYIKIFFSYFINGV